MRRSSEKDQAFGFWIWKFQKKKEIEVRMAWILSWRFWENRGEKKKKEKEKIERQLKRESWWCTDGPYNQDPDSV